jgi:hypothetical protein
MGKLYCQKPLRSKHKDLGSQKEKYLTQRSHKHCRVNFQFHNIGKFKVPGKTIQGARQSEKRYLVLERDADVVIPFLTKRELYYMY